MKRLTFLLLLGLIAGCSKPVAPSAGVNPHTQDNITKAEMRQVLTPLSWQGHYGSNLYAKVDEAWLSGFYERYRQHMFSAYGVVRWDAKADCDFWAQQYAAHAKAEFFNASFSSSTPAQQIAVGEFWYCPDPAQPTKGHAINVLVTNQGVVFLEPQTGQRVHPTREQIAEGAFLRF